MRYSLTLPLALAAVAAAPALSAQDATPPVETPAAAPQTTPPADDTVTPPEGDPVAAEPTTTVASPATGATATMTAEQKAAYDAWPANARTYFDGLTPARQAIFLRIADADKLRIVALSADQQAQVWTSLEAQAAQQKATTPPAN